MKLERQLSSEEGILSGISTGAQCMPRCRIGREPLSFQGQRIVVNPTEWWGSVISARACGIQPNPQGHLLKLSASSEL